MKRYLVYEVNGRNLRGSYETYEAAERAQNDFISLDAEQEITGVQFPVEYEIVESEDE